MRVLIIVALCFSWTTPLIAFNQRLLVDAKVNGASVVLAFDTGAEVSALFRRTARRLNLSAPEPPSNTKAKAGKVLAGLSEECRFELGNSITKARFPVVDLPRHFRPRMDGLLAWADARNTILQIAADRNRLSVLRGLPESIDTWAKWTIRQDCRTSVVPLLPDVVKMQMQAD